MRVELVSDATYPAGRGSYPGDIYFRTSFVKAKEHWQCLNHPLLSLFHLYSLFHRSKRNLIEIAYVDGLTCIGLDDKIPNLTRPFLAEVFDQIRSDGFHWMDPT